MQHEEIIRVIAHSRQRCEWKGIQGAPHKAPVVMPTVHLMYIRVPAEHTEEVSMGGAGHLITYTEGRGGVCDGGCELGVVGGGGDMGKRWGREKE